MNITKGNAINISIAAVTGYSVYEIGKLSDKIPHEGLYVSSVAIVSLVSVFGAALSNKPVDKATSILFATMGYAVSRGIFKQKPVTSLIIGALIGGGAYYLQQHPELLQKKAKVNLNAISVKPI